ncbi:hypothetical protein lbkm_3774 [Lachnospiraceae bacterium KM106-2]|nr:hypothetical protein lbkm_3774 [Lachnospiraceae bacterium KM106-2]
MFDTKGRFIIENFAQKSTFASFLPGISGRFGIPIWSFYVNRGQAITSFGIRDKDHAIMEFSPAHQAYQYTDRCGFRTFLKVEGKYIESFRNHKNPHKMYIGSNELEIEEVDLAAGIQTNVLYYTLPGEPVGALIRKMTITNISDEKKEIQVLDGMPAVIPYGINLEGMKTMAQTLKAWMQVDDIKEKRPFYHVRFSTLDSTIVKKIDGGNFYLSWDQDGKRLKVLADPTVIFGSDTALDRAEEFIQKGYQELFQEQQVTVNQVPCAFSGAQKNLASKEKMIIYSVIGQAESKQIYHEFAAKIQSMEYFQRKYEQAERLTEKIGSVVRTKTANPVFDQYCEQSYIDNILRGGYPIQLSKQHIFYLYSRKHGDIERDYNFFCMLPEFYSQGNANFRDVNQNRRCDSILTPIVKDQNIKLFYNLIQLDGYNPLSVQMTKYQMTEDAIPLMLAKVEKERQGDLEEFLKKEFTPGELYHFVGNRLADLQDGEAFVTEILEHSKSIKKAEFSEGYWTDHWSYNLDLIESYLDLYPDKKQELLYEDESYTYYESRAMVLPRSKRYVETKEGIRQYYCVRELDKDSVNHTKVKTSYGKGETYCSNLMTKLFILAVNKAAALDPYGMGIEMEGGKPGWYDALNGLPGMFGSSMPDTYELCRMLEFMLESEETYQREIRVPIEVSDFIQGMIKSQNQGLNSSDRLFDRWDAWNRLKEVYRDKTRDGIDGTCIIYNAKELIKILTSLLVIVNEGIDKALAYGKEICPTYFAYEVKRYEKREEVIIPLEFSVITIPYFLEGPVHYLKLNNSIEKKRRLYRSIRTSQLYDKKLKMYKVNASLNNSSYELGRCRAFTPGWLENESIWLHMEYKYLLELLRSGLYEEFFHDLKTACVPFMDPEIYGRSPLENSSFIASSANPDTKIHGKGFVARLSGSTIEFIDMWRIMMFGERPFQMINGKLQFQLTPAIPAYLIGEEKKIQCRFMNTTDIYYQIKGEGSIIPGNCQIVEMKLFYKGAKIEIVENSSVSGSMACDIRDGKVSKIQVIIKK